MHIIIYYCCSGNIYQIYSSDVVNFYVAENCVHLQTTLMTKNNEMEINDAPTVVAKCES